MGDTLGDYRAKRDFGRTPEPTAPPLPEAAPSSAAPLPPPPGEAVFVIHRHEARRLHYDMRLEMGGVLKSWAVPKGFSYDPADKHLAVRTEDHPIEYETFEGMIPKGEYGAGTMTIWDHGTYRLLAEGDWAAAVESGKFEVVFYGRRLRGEWHVVRTKENWLLFKARDRHAAGEGQRALDMDLSAARLAAMPRKAPRLMKVGARGEPFSDPAWVFEMRFDGRRVLAAKRGAEVELLGSAGRGALARMPELAAPLAALRADDALLDGVLVAVDERGRPSRELLEALLASPPIEVPAASAPIADAAATAPAAASGGAAKASRAGAKASGAAAKAFSAAAKAQGSAANAKGGSPLAPRLAYYAFDLLHYDRFDLRDLALLDRKALLAAILPRRGNLLYVDHVAGRGVELAHTVAAAGLPAVVAKRAASPYRAGASEDWRECPVAASPASTGESVEAALQRRPAAPARAARVQMSNLDKVYWPAEGYTKGDLLRYYEQVSDVLLPYLHERPVHLYRWPDGITGKSFYQQNAPDGCPDWVATEVIQRRHKEQPVRQILCNDRDTLLYLINLGSIDLHPWMSRRGSLESPDYAVIDFDPKDAPFADVVKLARETGKLLRGVGLRPLLKTSGASGLHVHIPLRAGYTYDQARMFCEGVCRLIAKEHKDIATVERNLQSRGRRVYLDFGQNRRGQTIVPPYAVRPQPGATVSTPLAWDELTGDLHPSQHTILTVPARLQARGDLFRPLLEDRQDLLPAIAALQRLLGR